MTGQALSTQPVWRGTRWLFSAAIVLVVSASCTTSADDESSNPVPTVALQPNAYTEDVADLCRIIFTAHSKIINAANSMAVKEIHATDSERADMAAQALDRMIEAVQQAEIPSEPSLLVEGLVERQQLVIEHTEARTAEFRATWHRIDDRERLRAIPRVFYLGEGLIGETKPRLQVDAPEALVEAVRSEPHCRHTVR